MKSGVPTRKPSGSKSARFVWSSHLAPDLGQSPRLALQVLGGLKIQPELGAVSEVHGKSEGRIRRDGSPAFCDLINAAGRYSNVESQTILRDSQRRQRFLGQYLAGWIGVRFTATSLCSQWQSAISTSYAFPAFHLKQIRHWSLTLIECCPALSLVRFSRRLAGGIRKSSMLVAASRIASLRRAILSRLTANSYSAASFSGGTFTESARPAYRHRRTSPH